MNVDANWVLVVITTIYTVATIFICWANWRSSSAAHKQTEEMMRAAQLQVVPVMSIKEFKPSLSFWGGEKGLFPFPSITIQTEICNKSNSPIIDLDGRITIFLPGEEPLLFLTDRFVWPVIEINGGSTELQLSMSRNGDVKQVVRYLNALVGEDSVNPFLACHFKYKNILGAGFEYKLKYQLKAFHNEKVAKDEIRKICSQLISPDEHLRQLLDVIASKTDDLEFCPVYHKCVVEGTGGNIRTDKIDNYEISMILRSGDFAFRAITDKEFQTLDFADSNYMPWSIL